jgi:hypothetical protein
MFGILVRQMHVACPLRDLQAPHCRQRSSKSLGKAVPEADIHQNGYDEHAEPADVEGADASPSDSGHSGDIEAGNFLGCLLTGMVTLSRGIVSCQGGSAGRRRQSPEDCCMQCMHLLLSCYGDLTKPCGKLADSCADTTLFCMQARAAMCCRRNRGGAPLTPRSSRCCWTGRCACAASRPSPPRTCSSSSSSVRCRGFKRNPVLLIYWTCSGEPAQRQSTLLLEQLEMPPLCLACTCSSQ